MVVTAGRCFARGGTAQPGRVWLIGIPEGIRYYPEPLEHSGNSIYTIIYSKHERMHVLQLHSCAWL